MNILDKLPFLSTTTEEEVTEIDEAQAKKDRIAFHRSHVKNGPASFKTLTSGQVRRAEKRMLAGSTKRARRAQIRQFHADQREAATLRGHLQAASVISYADPTRVASSQAALASIVWIIQRFAEEQYADETGRIEVTMEVITGALTGALNRWQRLVGDPVTPLSPAYRLPVSLAHEISA